MAAKKKTTKKKTAPKKSGKGKRYTDAVKKEVIEFVNRINSERGRGGVAAATKKFKITALTISNWLKNAGGAATGGARGSRKRGGGIWEQMVTLKSEIDDLEERLEAKRAQFDRLKKRL